MSSITRTVWILSLVSLFTDMASDMLYPVLPSYLSSIGFSIAVIGLLEGVAEATAGLSKGYFGHLSDLSGKRLPFVRMGYALSAISKPLMAILPQVLWIFGARTLDRLGKGMRSGARDAMLADESEKSERGTVFGFHRSMDTVGAALGPMLALVWLYFRPGDYIPLFFIAFVPGLVSVVLLFIMREKPVSEMKPQKRVKYFEGWKNSPAQYKWLILGLGIFALLNSSDIFLLLRARQSGLSDSEVVGLYIFYNLVFALFAYPLGRLSDKIGLKRIFISGLFVFVLVYALMSLGLQGWMFYLLFLLYGIYAAATEGLAKAWISKVCVPDQKATAIGTYAGIQSVCALFASSWAGFLWQWQGFGAMFASTALLVAVLILFFVFKLREP
jgi:MFS family permease